MQSNVPHIIELNAIGSSDLGYITVAEYQEDIPFDIKRVYWTYYTPNNVTRGHHAHKNLEQCIFAVSGKIDFELINKNGKKFRFTLDSPKDGLYIPPMHWRTIKFTHSAVLLCLASHVYMENDYIRDYNEFMPAKINFVNFTKEILNLSWAWLNDKQTKYLTNTPDFTKEQQLKWFNTLPNNNYFIKGVEYNSVPIGVVGLKKITAIDAEYWGYIGEKDYRGRGIGKKMIDFIILKCQELGLHNVYLKVIKDNKPAITLYKRKGFSISDENAKEYIMIRKVNV